MKDPTVPDVLRRKKIMFYDTEERQASLRIRCQYDQLSQSQFFRIMLSGYLEGDSGIVKYIERFKKEHSLQGQKKRAYIEKMHEAGDRTKRAFGLDKEDIENIFDILEKDEFND